MDFTKGPWVRMMEDLDMSGRERRGEEGGSEGRWCVSPRSTVVVDVCWLTGTGCFPASHRSTLGSPPSVHCCGIAQAGMLVLLLPTRQAHVYYKYRLLRGVDRTRYVCVLSISLVIHMAVCMECKVLCHCSRDFGSHLPTLARTPFLLHGQLHSSKASRRQLQNGKVAHLRVMLKCLSPTSSKGNASAVLADPTGMRASPHLPCFCF